VTALNFTIQEDEICIAMDTLSISADDHLPLSFMTKFAILPHIQSIVTGTGPADFVSSWMDFSRRNVFANDIDQLNEATPSFLREASGKLVSTEEQCATVYHFGYSNKRERYLAFVYRSTSGWLPEEILSGLGIKPNIDFPFKGNLKLPYHFVELMK
jgi:hypothetical protein